MSSGGNDPTGMTLEEMAPPGRETAIPYGEKSAADLEAVFDVPVRISVVLGRTRIPVAQLLKMDIGTVVELDRQVGEAVEIFVNERLVARGERVEGEVAVFDESVVLGIFAVHADKDHRRGIGDRARRNHGRAPLSRHAVGGDHMNGAGKMAHRVPVGLRPDFKFLQHRIFLQ